MEPGELHLEKPLAVCLVPKLKRQRCSVSGLHYRCSAHTHVMAEALKTSVMRYARWNKGLASVWKVEKSVLGSQCSVHSQERGDEKPGWDGKEGW